MTTIILDTIARALDALPFTMEQRAEVFHAWDTAPDQPIDSQDFDAWDAYFHGPAGRAWHRVRDMRIHRIDGKTNSYYATTLDEAACHEAGPTKTEILRALANAAHLINPHA